MSANLIDIINTLNLAELRPAVRSDDKEKEKLELPEILRKFEKEFKKISGQSSPFLERVSLDEDFYAKLVLLLGFYKDYDANIYSALQQLERAQVPVDATGFFEEEKRVLDSSVSVLSSPMMVDGISMRLKEIIAARASSLATSGKMDRVAIYAMIGRIITPDQSFSSESSDNEEDKLNLKKLYDPLIPQNSKETIENFYNAIVDILTNDNIPFSRKLEDIFSLYKQYDSILRSATEAFLYPSQMNGKSWLLENIFLPRENRYLGAFIQDKVKEGEESFFTDEALKQEIIAAYLKMLFQYVGNRITFEIKGLSHRHQELLEITTFQTISAIFERNKEVARLRDIKNKDKDLIERFKVLIEDRRDNTVHWQLEQERKKLREKQEIIRKLTEETNVIAGKIDRLEDCSQACDTAMKSMDLLKGDVTANPSSLKSAVKSFLNTRKNKPSSSLTSSPVGSETSLRIGGGSGTGTSSSASVASAPLPVPEAHSAQQSNVAGTTSEPVKLKSDSKETPPQTMFWSRHHSSKSSLPTSPAALATRHRAESSASMSPVPAPQEEQNIPEASTTVNPQSSTSTSPGPEVQGNDPVRMLKKS